MSGSGSHDTIAKVAFAASIGTFLEFYDFFVAAIAASLAWPSVFFGELSIPLASALSIASFGVALLTRPVGAILFGHLADTSGRKDTFAWTLLIMSSCTLGIALVPSYSSIGALAPILLVLFRAIYGVGLGGEWGPATTWVSESVTSSRWRGFWTGWVVTAIPVGQVVGIASMTAAKSSLSDAAFLAWGWRIPFLIGALAGVIGIAIRNRSRESEMFTRVRVGGGIERVPALQVIRTEGKRIVLLLLALMFGPVCAVFVLIPYSLTYLVRIGISPAFASLAVTIGSISGIFTTIGGAALGDIFGRKKVLFVSAAAILVFMFPYFILLNTLSSVLIIVSLAVLYGIETMNLGVAAGMLTEQFPTMYRASGSGITVQMMLFFAGVLTTFVLPGMIVGFGVAGAWPYVATIEVGFCAVALVSLLVIKETRGVALG